MRPATPDDLIARLAERQHGVFTLDQALARGFTPDVARYRVRSRRWIRVHHGVYRLAGTNATFESAAMARVLACGDRAVAFRRTAAALFAVDGSDRSVLEVAVPRSRRVKLAHQLTALRPTDVARIAGIPVTTPERTIIDLAAVLAVDRLEDALDDMVRRALVRPRALEARLAAMQRRGTRGVGVLLGLVRTRSVRDVSGSRRENVVRRALIRSGLPEPTRQHVILDEHGTFVARPDLSYPERRLYIEYDGGLHDSPRQRQRDIDRQNRLTALGWRPIRFTKLSLSGPMSALVDIVRRSCDSDRR